MVTGLGSKRSTKPTMHVSSMLECGSESLLLRATVIKPSWKSMQRNDAFDPVAFAGKSSRG